MGRAHSNDDIEDTDAIGIDAGIDDIGTADITEMASSRDDSAETRTVTSRCRIREQLNADIEAFLAAGGCISHVDARAVSGMPRGSGGDAGSRLI